MSVVTMHSEEFPEHSFDLAAVFVALAEARPATPARKTPLSIEVTDFDQRIDGSGEPLNSCAQFKSAVTGSFARVLPAPIPCYTMEDGEQSVGATETAKGAAKILADLEDSDDADLVVEMPNCGRAKGPYARRGWNPLECRYGC